MWDMFNFTCFVSTVCSQLQMKASKTWCSFLVYVRAYVQGGKGRRSSYGACSWREFKWNFRHVLLEISTSLAMAALYSSIASRPVHCISSIPHPVVAPLSRPLVDFMALPTLWDAKWRRLELTVSCGQHSFLYYGEHKICNYLWNHSYVMLCNVV
jgi:hypothetical protein